jgi:hypothetical protein
VTGRIKLEIRASLVSFLKTGRIGPVSIGMTMADVERIAGPPEDSRDGVWWYGSIELGFRGSRRCASRLFYVQVEYPGRAGYFVGYRKLVLRDELSARHGNGPLDLDTFLRFARRNNIRLTGARHPSSIRVENRFEMFTEGGIVADFRLDEETGRVLFSTFISEYTSPERLRTGFGRDVLASMLRHWERRND